MKTWWSAIDVNHTSYDELKHRRVVAQGWRHLGDISTLSRFIPDGWESFAKVVQLLGDTSYRGESWWEDDDRKETRAPTVMWNLLSVEAGDLVVGIEGTRVRGICQVSASAVETYQYQPAWEYAQTIGFPVTWHDWDQGVMGPPPQAPAHGVLGIRGLKNERDIVQNAWVKLGA